MGGLNVDLTIRLGDILTMIGLFGGGIFVVFMMRADMRILSTRVQGIENSMTSIGERLNGITAILVEQAKHDQRILTLEQRIRDLVSRPA
jgi:uncharacterized membrane protein YgaE (UPF0421/DUF939 family)